MKLNIHLSRFLFLSLTLCSTHFFAQKSKFDVIRKELTKQQMNLLQKEKEVIKANRKAFKGSLTRKQLIILRDKTVSKNERRKRLSATFSVIQKEMVKEQQVSLRKTRDNFRKTLTSEQRKILRERIDKIRKSKNRGKLKGEPLFFKDANEKNKQMKRALNY
jgi:hypothetical protein